MSFDQKYYESNSQNVDRPALAFYYRVWKKYCLFGPVLEFGCGVGHLARRLSRSTKTFGLEINQYALSELSHNAPNVEIISSLGELPCNSLGSIVSLHVFEHISDDDLSEIAAEFLRVLKPGGRVMIVVPDPAGRARDAKKDDWMGFRDATHINLKSAADWSRAFQGWNFNVLVSAADGYYDFPYSRTLIGRIFSDGARIFKTGIQFLLARLFLKPGDGEACIFILEKTYNDA